jgi:hypothetical protein
MNGKSPPPLPASPSESARARSVDPNEWNSADENSSHYPVLATERHPELQGVSEDLITDKQKTPQLLIERRVGDEWHRQLEVSGQAGDAQVALAAVKLKREETTEGTAEDRLHGRRTKRSPSGAKPKSKSEAICTASSGLAEVEQQITETFNRGYAKNVVRRIRSIFHSLPRSALGNVAILDTENLARAIRQYGKIVGVKKGRYSQIPGGRRVSMAMAACPS